MSLRIVIRYRAAKSRLARFVSGSLVAHAVLGAVILVVPIFRRTPSTFDDAMVVALAGPLPGPPAAPAPAAALPSAPPPPPAPAPKEAHTVREVPKPQPKKKEAPATPKATPAPAPSTPTPPKETAPSAGTGQEGGGAAGATGPTGVTAVLGGGDASLGFYGAAVKAALEAAWIKPYLEDQGETYSVTVTFVIGRDGTARDPRVAESSGVPSLDRSALRAVMEASPLPPIPPSWSGDALPATMRFDLTPEGR